MGFSIFSVLVIIFFLGVTLIIIINYYLHLRRIKKLKEGMRNAGIEYLINALNDKSTSEEAIELLGKTKDPLAVDALITFVNSPEIRMEEDGYLLSLGLKSLAEIGSPKAVDFIIEKLNDESLTVRLFASLSVNLLAQNGIKDARTIEPLISILKEIKCLKEKRDQRYDKSSQEWIEDVLKTISGKDFGDDAEKWDKWWKDNKNTFGR